MSEKHRNSVLFFGVLTVIFLIIFTHSYNNKSLFKASTFVAQPFFPVQKKPQKENMQALLIGELKLEGKCLKVGENLVVWPCGFSLDGGGDDLRVLNERGKFVASVGDTVRLSGGQVNTDKSPTGRLAEYRNKECRGPLWITGKVLADRN